VVRVVCAGFLLAAIALVRPAYAGEPAPEEIRGRTAGADGGDAVRAAARVAMFPLHLVTEFGLRRPVYAAAAWADRNHVAPIVNEVLEPTPDFKWHPTLSVDFGVLVAVGLRARWRSFLHPDHDVEARMTTGGDHAWQLEASDRLRFGDGYMGVRGGFLTRGDRAYYGLGQTTANVRTHFTQTRYDAQAFLGVARGMHVRFELTGGYTGERTGPGHAPSIETRFDPAAVPGLGSLELVITRLDLVLDSRATRDEPDGSRIALNASFAQDVRTPERAFVTAELDAEAAFEVMAPDRVLAVRAYAVDTAPTGREPVPFTYQAMLGWKNHHGFVWGRFRGESAVMAELSYRYPIAYYVDAEWVASVGTVSARHFVDVRPGALTGSLGLGFRTRRAGGAPIELLFAVGTTRFEEAFALQSFRVYLGIAEGL